MYLSTGLRHTVYVIVTFLTIEIIRALSTGTAE